MAENSSLKDRMKFFEKSAQLERKQLARDLPRQNSRDTMRPRHASLGDNHTNSELDRQCSTQSSPGLVPSPLTLSDPLSYPVSRGTKVSLSDITPAKCVLEEVVSPISFPSRSSVDESASDNGRVVQDKFNDINIVRCKFGEVTRSLACPVENISRSVDQIDRDSGVSCSSDDLELLSDTELFSVDSGVFTSRPPSYTALIQIAESEALQTDSGEVVVGSEELEVGSDEVMRSDDSSAVSDDDATVDENATSECATADDDHSTVNTAPFNSPFEGTINLSMTAKESVCSEPPTHKGFLTIFQEESGLGSWNRRWCSVQDNKIYYWLYPEDEVSQNKEPFGEIDLRSSKTDTVTIASRLECARPNTFVLVILAPAVPGDRNSIIAETNNKTTQTKYMLSADSREERKQWMEILNQCLLTITSWNTK